MSQSTEASDPRSWTNLEEPEPTSGLGKEGLDHPFLALATWLLVFTISFTVTRRPVWLHGAVSFAVGAVGLVLLPEWTYRPWVQAVLGVFPIIVVWPELRNLVMLHWRFTIRQCIVWVMHLLRDALYG